MKKVLVTGSRNWDDTDAIVLALFPLRKDYDVLISGNCPTGADAIAEDVWTMLGGVLELYPADWKRYGRNAGPLRNADMVSKNPDLCLAFIKNKSKGATHCLGIAQKVGIPTKIWTVDEN